MNNWLTTEIDFHFSFIRTDYGFTGPFSYNWASELHCFYAKDNLRIDFGYDSSFSATLVKFTKIPISSEIPLKLISSNEYKGYDLKNILNKNQLLLFANNSDSSNQLRLFVDILRSNPELLKGDLKRFSFLSLLRNGNSLFYI